MKTLLGLVLAASCVLATPVQAQTISLTPRTNGGSGALPNGYDQIDFSTFDGNWAQDLFLPTQPRDGMRVNIHTAATFDSTLDISRVDVGMPALELSAGNRYSLTYSAAAGQWTFLSGDLVTRLTPQNGAATIPDNPNKITYFSVSDANPAASVALPKLAAPGSVVVVQSTAASSVTVTPANRLYVSSANLRKGDSFSYVYRGDFGAWVSSGATTRHLGASDIAGNGGTVPLSGSPRNLVQLHDGGWIGQIRLPASAGDRDRITIRSQASSNANIESVNTGFTGTMILRSGDEYQFMYAANLRRWELIVSPVSFHQAGAVADGQLPNMVNPHTVVNAADGNWAAAIKLPLTRRVGDRVTIKTQAASPIAVRSGQQTFASVTAGESVTFVVGANGQWQRQTRTLDMLMLYSAASASRFGADTMRSRLAEGLSLTNDALENSLATFRFRAVSTREFASPSSWTSLDHVLPGLAGHTQAQTWRNQAKADGTYYEGTEEGCGLAYLGPAASHMIGSGSTDCGTTVARHELGHNMGLEHSEGRTMTGTIMNGNEWSLFGAPYLYVPNLGIPLTLPGGVNEMQTMNNRAPTVAAFR